MAQRTYHKFKAANQQFEVPLIRLTPSYLFYHSLSPNTHLSVPSAMVLMVWLCKLYLTSHHSCHLTLLSAQLWTNLPAIKLPSKK
jgi:hypothetical protein